MEIKLNNHRTRMRISLAGIGVLGLYVALMAPSLLRHDREQYQAATMAALMAKMEAGIIVVDDKMTVEFISDTAARLLECDGADVLGKSMEWMIPDTMLADHRKAHGDWWRSNSTAPMILDCTGLTRKGTPIALHLRLSPVKIKKAWKIVVCVEEQQPFVRRSLP